MRRLKAIETSSSVPCGEVSAKEGVEAIHRADNAKMIEFLKWVFNDKLVEDLRPVVATFQLPGVDGAFAIYPPHPSFWIQLIAVGEE